MRGGHRVRAFPYGRTSATGALSSAITCRDAAGSFRFPQPGPNTCGTTAFEPAPDPTQRQESDATRPAAVARHVLTMVDAARRHGQGRNLRALRRPPMHRDNAAMNVARGRATDLAIRSDLRFVRTAQATGIEPACSAQEAFGASRGSRGDLELSPGRDRRRVRTGVRRLAVSARSFSAKEARDRAETARVQRSDLPQVRTAHASLASRRVACSAAGRRKREVPGDVSMRRVQVDLCLD